MGIIETYVDVNCGICGKQFKAICIDGHVMANQTCDECFKSVIQEWIDQNSSEGEEPYVRQT